MHTFEFIRPADAAAAVATAAQAKTAKLLNAVDFNIKLTISLGINWDQC